MLSKERKKKASAEPKPKRVKLTWDDRWRLFHLVNGGMSVRRELEAALGISLKEIPIDDVVNQCVNAAEARRTLCESVWCNYCGAPTNVVPCQRCVMNRRGDNFKTLPERLKDHKTEIVDV